MLMDYNFASIHLAFRLRPPFELCFNQIFFFVAFTKMQCPNWVAVTEICKETAATAAARAGHNTRIQTSQQSTLFFRQNFHSKLSHPGRAVESLQPNRVAWRKRTRWQLSNAAL